MASLPFALSGATAVYDQNGHIFIFGGATSSAAATSTALRYTVATNTWATVASLPTATTEAAAVLGADGNIYVLGGKDTTGAAQATVQEYSITGNSWSAATSLPSAVSDEAAVTDASGRIMVIGGKNASGPTVSTVSVSQSLGNFAVAPVLTQPANVGTMAGLPFTDAINAFGLPSPTFSLTAAPAGMAIDPVSGVISWTPPLSLRGAQPVTVQGTNASGSDTKSFSVTVVADTIPPTAPTGLTMTSETTTTVSFSWNASTDPIGVAGYNIYTYVPAYGGYHGSPRHPAVYTLVGNSTTNSGVATGLTPGSQYNFVVSAYDLAGNKSGYSNIDTVTLFLAPSIHYSYNSVVDPPVVNVIANHPLRPST